MLCEPKPQHNAGQTKNEHAQTLYQRQHERDIGSNSKQTAEQHIPSLLNAKRTGYGKAC